jgi:MFS transporter, ACDE family, multidrug resistance protein
MSLLSTSSTSSSERKGEPKAVWAVFFASVIAFMGIGLVDPILPAISNQLAASPSEVTLLFSSYTLIMATAMLITGAVTTRIGIKKTLLLGAVIVALFSTFGGLSSNIWVIIGLRGGWGLGNALLVATALTAIVTLSRSGIKKSVILYETAIGLGFAMGPLLGGLLGEISWRWPFFSVGILMIVSFISILILLPNLKEQKTGEHAKAVTSLADPFHAMKHGSIAVIGLVAALYYYGFFTLLAYAPFVTGLDARGIGFVFLGWGVLVAITSVFMAPKLQKKFGTINSMCMTLTLFAAVLIVMGIFVSIQWVVILCIISAGAFMGNTSTLVTAAMMGASNIEKSTVSSAYGFLRFIGGAIAPFLSGELAKIFTSNVPFIVGGCLVVTAVIFVIINRQYVDHIDQSKTSHQSS